MSDIKVKFFHSRVPASRLNPIKGKPKGWILQPYSRKKGWVGDNTIDQGPASRGGYTYCTIEIGDDGHVIGSGKALCSFSQNFSYWEGRRISQNRAIDIAILNGYTTDIRDADLQKLYYQDAAQNPLPDGAIDMMELEL